MTTLGNLAFAPALDAASPLPPATTTGAVQGAPRLVLRLEGAAVLLAALVAYSQLGGSWGLFAALFLTPDLAFLGYLAGPRAGAIAYNAMHSYVGPVLLALLGSVVPGLLPLAVIWAGHVGFDRMLGYGLKYATGFRYTHLGQVGRAPRHAVRA
jgi:hypothetical protein